MEGRHKITDIRPQQKRRNRLAVFLDNEFAFGIHQDVLLAAGIAAGDELTDEQIAEIQELERRHAAKEKAIRLLAYRARSRKEIADRLRQAGFQSAEIDWVLQELERLKLIDDGDFARLYARTRMAARPVGALALKLELKQRGVPEPEIVAALQEAYGEKSEAELARELAAKQKKKQLRLDEEKAKSRTADFLLRHGFGYDLVQEIIEEWDKLDT
ncbi:MAG: RecX family transcriptional regulator [candidate division KSB1 bacterium]|nr:RecX family transcriptional regulator [candidate division KSB1 bacterium]